jgi:hypothetical protein
MKSVVFTLSIVAVIALNSCTQKGEQVLSNVNENESIQTDYFQVQIFSFETAEQESMLDSYFKDALLPALHRTEIKDVGVFKPIDELNERTGFMMVVTPFQSLSQFEQLPGLLAKDAEYQQSASAYINAAHDNPPYTRIESMILRSFSATPQLVLPELSTPRSERVYEFRSYEAATEKLYKLKVEMFNEGESALFQELKFNPVFFCEVLSSAHMPHLIYMTTHADTAAQARNWDAFTTHPEWDRMKNMERYQNTVSSITKYLLYPTEYSDY